MARQPLAELVPVLGRVGLLERLRWMGRHGAGTSFLPGVVTRDRERETMPPREGLADKIDNRYEGRIAVRRILLLDEQYDSARARFEQSGDDSFGWWVQRGTDLASIRRSSGSNRWMMSGPS